MPDTTPPDATPHVPSSTSAEQPVTVSCRFTVTELGYLWLGLEKQCDELSARSNAAKTPARRISSAFLLIATRDLQSKVWECYQKAIDDTTPAS